MKQRPTQPGQVLEFSISLLLLLVLLAYTSGLFIAAPYSGFYFNPRNGAVDAVFLDIGGSGLQVGDIILRVGPTTLGEFRQDRSLILFENARKGDTVELAFERDGQSRTVSWVFPGFNDREFLARLLNVWILAFAFWLAGFAALVSIRPRDLRRRLFIAANYLTALFLIFGSLSSWHLWGSSALLHAATWIMAPIYLRLHWLFPRPLGSLPGFVWVALYVAASILSLAEFLHLLPRNLYQLGFLIALPGSLLLLLAHLIRQKNERRVVSLLLLSFLLAFSLSIAFAVALAFDVILNLGPLTYISMPFMPLAYFYLVNRRQLGGMETRVTRLVSLYAFLILLGAALILVVIPFMRNPLHPESWGFLMAALAFAASGVTALLLPRFRAFVDRRFFGITLPHQRLPETYSNRIAASASLPSLLALLEKEVFPSLLIRRYAFLKTTAKRASLLLSKEIPADSFDPDELTSQAGVYLPADSPNAGWMRLILPLKVGDSTLGFWLLGKRDPDDFYPQDDIPILQSLADQTAIALSNLLQEERLRSLYQSNMDRIETERISLARDLHDSVLNALAAMRMRLDENILPPGFLSDYEELKERLRGIIENLRPPMLDQGLMYALTELAQDLREQNRSIEIALNVQAGGERLPENMETHLYYIIREACMNALRHANAKNLSLSGVVTPRHVALSIRDDGDGFPFETQPDLRALLAGNHFGLAGMLERAALIGADVDIRSMKNEGTIVRIVWQLKS